MSRFVFLTFKKKIRENLFDKIDQINKQRTTTYAQLGYIYGSVGFKIDIKRNLVNTRFSVKSNRQFFFAVVILVRNRIITAVKKEMSVLVCLINKIEKKNKKLNLEVFSTSLNQKKSKYRNHMK